MAAKKKAENVASLALPIEWHVGDEIKTLFATNLIVQSSEHDTKITFFDIQPPLITGTPEQIKKSVEGLKSVRANCVARIGIATAHVPEFIEALRVAHQNAFNLKNAAESANPGNGEKQ
jgi:hypothetical protein